MREMIIYYVTYKYYASISSRETNNSIIIVVPTNVLLCVRLLPSDDFCFIWYAQKTEQSSNKDRTNL